VTPKRGYVLVAAILGVLTMAPTVGDVGGCGRQATELDRAQFESARKQEDCDRCQACGLGTDRCVRACNPQLPSDTLLPDTCRPLFHDGEVCLRALEAASCSSYATYVDDFAPAIPSECDFCRVAPTPATAPSTFGEGGVAK
jgi:hypothetical protein